VAAERTHRVRVTGIGKAARGSLATEQSPNKDGLSFSGPTLMVRLSTSPNVAWWSTACPAEPCQKTDAKTKEIQVRQAQSP
jgi:hypothetical protein